MKKFYFISGLPRAGSTLLSAILVQNPMCYASISSPVQLVTQHMTEIDQIGTNQLLTNDKIKLMIKSVFDVAYSDIDKPIIFDTNRSWTNLVELLNEVVDDLKIICCVRDIPSILNSFERVYRDNIYQYNSPVYLNSTQNVYFRCENLMKWDGSVGRHLASLKSAIHSTFADRIYILEYDSLVANPNSEMQNIYEFLGMDNFEHDFTKIENFKNIKDCDAQLNLVGLHDVQPTVGAINRYQLLPDDLIRQYSNLEYWRQHGF
jgi:sulfotransferase